jgi:hypothetical protein
MLVKEMVTSMTKIYKPIFDTKLILWIVKNTQTGAIQSAWGNNQKAATQVAQDLNRSRYVWS